MESVLELIKATSAIELKNAASLFREYQQALGVDLCFQGFEQELASLPGKYAHPKGAILLAMLDGEPVGCVAVRPTNSTVCEMKRLYVKPAAQGMHIGRQLAEAIVELAGRLGYQTMQLDTLETLVPALRLYESLGFERITSYYANPLEGVVYMEKTLNSDK